MPFDSANWPQAKPDVFSLEGLIAWLETQPPETSYNWHDCHGGCLIGKYFIAMRVHRDLSRPAYGELFYKRFPLRSYGDVCMTEPWTFGAALSRARALLASRPKE